MLAFDTDLAPIVGQQVTLDSGNGAAVRPRITTLIRRAQAHFTSAVLGGAVKECDLVVKGTVGSVERGWLYDPGSDVFIPNKTGEASLADAALEAGGRVHGVIPQGLVDLEVAHGNLHALDVVETMHERKARMIELADGFIALPGGHGTLDELFEVQTWLQLRLHRSPVGVLNLNGFYDHALAHLDRCVDEGFLRPEHRAQWLVADTPGALLEQMSAWDPGAQGSWNDR